MFGYKIIKERKLNLLAIRNIFLQIKNKGLQIETKALRSTIEDINKEMERFSFLSNFFDECRRLEQPIPDDLWKEFCDLHRDYHKGREIITNPEAFQELSDELKARQERNEKISKLIGKDVSKMFDDSLEQIKETERYTQSLIDSVKDLLKFKSTGEPTDMDEKDLFLNLQISLQNLERVFKPSLTNV